MSRTATLCPSPIGSRTSTCRSPRLRTDPRGIGRAATATLSSARRNTALGSVAVAIARPFGSLLQGQSSLTASLVAPGRIGKRMHRRSSASRHGGVRPSSRRSSPPPVRRRPNPGLRRRPPDALMRPLGTCPAGQGQGPIFLTANDDCLRRAAPREWEAGAREPGALEDDGSPACPLALPWIPTPRKRTWPSNRCRCGPIARRSSGIARTIANFPGVDSHATPRILRK